jgi:hypothetical protein
MTEVVQSKTVSDLYQTRRVGLFLFTIWQEPVQARTRALE